MSNFLVNQSKDILRKLGQALTNINLYGAAHPLVQKTIKECHQPLYMLLSTGSEELKNAEELVFSLDHERLLVNGLFLGHLKDQPRGFQNLFRSFNLHSLSFVRGVEENELTLFCKLLNENIDELKKIGLANYLLDKKIAHIRINEAFYVKVEKESDQVIEESGAAVLGEEKEEARKGQEEGGKEEAQSLESQFQKELERAKSVYTSEIARLLNELKRTNGVFHRAFRGCITLDREGKIITVDAIAGQILNQDPGGITGQRLEEILEPAVHLLALNDDIGLMPSVPKSPAVGLRSAKVLEEALANCSALVLNSEEQVVGLLYSPPDLIQIKKYDDLKKNFISRIVAAFTTTAQALDISLSAFHKQNQAKLDTNQKAHLEDIVRRKDSINAVIRELRHYSMIENGQFKVFNVAISPYTLINDSADHLRPWAKAEGGIELKVNQEKGLPNVQCDPNRTIEILRYLIFKAIKHCPHAGAVEIELLRGAGKLDGFIVFSVADTSQQRPQTSLEKILAEFFPADEQIEETGLGYPLCEKLITLQKGKLWVDEDREKGTRVCFTLPVFVAPVGYTPPEKKEEKKTLSWWEKLIRLLGLGGG